MVDAGVRQGRAYHQCGDAGPRSELVMNAPGGAALAGRGDVVPLATELVIGDHDKCVLGFRPGFDRPEQVDEVVTPVRFAGVPGVLVLRAIGFDKTHGRQRAVFRSRDEPGLVLQMGTARLSRGVGGEVVERLVVILEEGAGMSGLRVVPTAGVPVPGNTGTAQPVTDVRICDVVDQRKSDCARTVRWARRLDGVDRIVAACHRGIGVRAAHLGQPSVLHTGGGRFVQRVAVGESVRVHDRVQVRVRAAWTGARVDRGPRGDQELVVQE